MEQSDLQPAPAGAGPGTDMAMERAEFAAALAELRLQRDVSQQRALMLAASVARLIEQLKRVGADRLEAEKMS